MAAVCEHEQGEGLAGESAMEVAVEVREVMDGGEGEVWENAAPDIVCQERVGGKHDK